MNHKFKFKQVSDDKLLKISSTVNLIGILIVLGIVIFVSTPNIELGALFALPFVALAKLIFYIGGGIALVKLIKSILHKLDYGSFDIKTRQIVSIVVNLLPALLIFILLSGVSSQNRKMMVEHRDVMNNVLDENADENALLRIALNEEYSITGRFMAIQKIKNQSHLKKILFSTTDADLLNYALRNVSDTKLFKDLAVNHPNEQVRRFALRSITDPEVIGSLALNEKKKPLKIMAINRTSDQNILKRIYEQESDIDIKIAAVKQIEDQVFFNKAALRTKNPQLLSYIIDRMTTQESLFKLSTVLKSGPLFLKIVGRIRDQQYLSLVAKSTDDETVLDRIADLIRDQALLFTKITDTENTRLKLKYLTNLENQKFLIRLLNSENDPEFRLKIVKKISTKSRLRRIAKQDKDPRVRRMAIKNISDQNLLKSILYNDDDLSCRNGALANIKDQRIIERFAMTKIDIPESQRRIAVYRLKNQQKLGEVFISNNKQSVKSTAILRINNQDVLSKVLDKRLSNETISKLLKSGNYIHADNLMKIVKLEDNAYGNVKALLRITDISVLKEIKKNEKSEYMRDLIRMWINVLGDASGKIKFADVLNARNVDLAKAYLNTLSDQKRIKNISRLVNQKIEETKKRVSGPSAYSPELDEYEQIFVHTVTRITDQSYLKKIIKEYWDLDVRAAAISNITDQEYLYAIWKNEKKVRLKRAALIKIDDPKRLKDIIYYHPYIGVRSHAILKVNDAAFLTDLIENGTHPDIRKMALIRKKMLNGKKNELINMVSGEYSTSIRMAALNLIDDDPILKSLILRFKKKRSQFGYLKHMKIITLIINKIQQIPLLKELKSDSAYPHIAWLAEQRFRQLSTRLP